MSRDSNTDIQYIRSRYGVPARLDGRVKYTGDPKFPGGRGGSIRGADGGHLLIRLDGDNEYPKPFHPTWKLEYEDAK